MLWLVPVDRVHSRREFTAPRNNAAPSLLPDGIPYNALVSFCGKGTQPQRDLQLLSHAVPRPPARWDTIPRFGQCLREGCDATDSPWHSWRPCWKVLPDRITYNALDSACEKGGLRQRAPLELLAAVLHQGRRSDGIPTKPW